MTSGFFPESVEVVVVRFFESDALLFLLPGIFLFLPGGPSLVAALAARRSVGGDDLFVQGRSASLTNLELPVVLEGALLTRNEAAAVAAAVEDVVEDVAGGGDTVRWRHHRCRGWRQRRVSALAAHVADVDSGLVQVRAGVALPPRRR